MRWIITDSGLGGLSVCAGLERKLAAWRSAEPLELLYVNATPSDRGGYNALATQADRIDLFDHFLHAVATRYAPDKIIIACNTLSVLYDQTSFAGETAIPVQGIVDSGVELCEQNLLREPDRELIIFATETTTEANTYPARIHGDGTNIMSQPCPELAHAISNDASGQTARSLLQGYCREAVSQLKPGSKSLFAFLGCTHYGYHAALFVELLADLGYSARILNPNQRLVDKISMGLDVMSAHPGSPPSILFISRYPIPEEEIRSMESYLENSAPKTLEALRSHTVLPTLF